MRDMQRYFLLVESLENRKTRTLTCVTHVVKRPRVSKMQSHVVLGDLLQIMTPLCIFPIDAGDEGRPLGNIARLTLEPALQSWEFNSFRLERNS